MVCRAPKIDVSTGDYSLARGELAEDITAASEVILALRSKRGSSPIAPWHGSRLHTIRKITPGARILAEFYATEALQFLVDRGDVIDLKATATITRRGIELKASYRDRAGQRRTVPYTHSVSA